MEKKKARRKQNIPKGESKADRFVRVVSPRVDKVVKALKQVGLCAGSNYESTPKQQHDIRTVLTASLQACYTSFEKKATAQQGFQFTS